jgi:hypothetical protein
MFRIIILSITMALAGCCAERSPKTTEPVPNTQLSRVVVNMDGSDNLSVGALNLAVSDLPLLVKESGADRPVVLYGFDLKKLIRIKQEFQEAGFKNVVIGAAVGE